MTDYVKAIADPSRMFVEPKDILKCGDLSWQQKVDVLKQWEYDAREMEVADEENMVAMGPDLLHDILIALRDLKAKTDFEHAPPTKQGGDIE